MTRFKKVPGTIFSLLVLAVVLGSCSGGVIGFGDVLDFEAPYLELDDGVPDPYYLILDPYVLIQGTCSDNVGVYKIVCEDSEDPNIIYGNATITSNGTRWHFEPDNFHFTMEDSGNQYVVRIVAYDRAGNTAERSTAYIKINVDFRPPVFENPIIYRSERRIMELLPLTTPDREGIRDLELDGKDPFANRQQFSDYYQNGAFWIRAELTEDETVLVGSSIVMYIYDVENDVEGQHVYSKVTEGSSVYSPQWLVLESELAAKRDKNGVLYGDRLYNEIRPERLYFRVRFAAEDIAGNKTNDRVYDHGSFCLYALPADRPKANTGGGVGQFVTAGSEIPIDVFDDDTLEIIWVDMLTVNQFNNYAGASNDEKLETIKGILESGGTVWNWRNQGTAAHGDTSDKAKVMNRLLDDGGFMPTILPESLTARVETGAEAKDYGDYRIIAIVRDRKDRPHTGPIYPDPIPFTLPADNETRWHPKWGLYSYPITIADENAPLIVIDTVNIDLEIGTGWNQYNPADHLGRENVPGVPGYTAPSTGVVGASTGNSPEENTFPSLTGGRYFWINGYTLDDNSKDVGKVEVFKIAWIPYYVSGGQDSQAVMTQVQNAMRYGGTYTYPAGVQYWELSDTDLNQDWDHPNVNDYDPDPETGTFSYFIRGSDQEIDDVPYTKQTFRKRFDILGGVDDLKPGEYKNFTREYSKGFGDPGSTHENDPKLFVLYAQDVDNNYTFRTIRLLGNTNPPNLNVYDFSLRDELIPLYNASNVNTNANAIIPGEVAGFNPANESHQAHFYDYFYNGILNVTQVVNGQTQKIYDNNDLSIPFHTYARETVLKLWAEASGEEGGGILINNIVMEDITEQEPVEVGCYNDDNKDLTYVMSLPDREVRSFRFTATNELGIQAKIERTVAVTSVAMLVDIISPLASGDYGVTPKLPVPPPNGQWDPDRIITLQAHFSGPVKIEVGDSYAGDYDADTNTAGFDAASYDPANRAKWAGLPVLNIRYQVFDNNSVPVWVYQQVPYTGPIEGKYSEDALYLEFKWPVPEGATGRVETMDRKVYDSDSAKINGSLPFPNDRPINLNGAKILDAEQGREVFLPGGDIGYNMPAWTDHHYSLQGETELDGSLNASYPGKQIKLDGKLPVLEKFSIGGKSQYIQDTLNPYENNFKSGYYFKSGETISFTLEASKRIRTSDPGNPRVEFAIWYPNYNTSLTDAQNITAGNTRRVNSADPSGNYFAEYVRPAGDNGMLFSVDVPADNTGNTILPNGTIVLKGISTAQGGVVDWVNNDLDLGVNNATLISKYGSTLAVVDKTVPGTVTPLLNDGSGNAEPNPIPPETVRKYNANPVLTMSGEASPTAEPWGHFTEYSMDGGVSWVTYPELKDPWTTSGAGGSVVVQSGQHQLTVRQRDLAENISAGSKVYPLDINSKFPEIVSIGIVEPAMTYSKPYFDDGGKIQFSLDFESPVYTTQTVTANKAYIIVADRLYGKDPDYSKAKNISAPIRVIAKPYDSGDPNYYSSTLYFEWGSEAIGKQMPNGVTIKEIHLEGDIRDAYNNLGVMSYRATTELDAINASIGINGNPASQYGWVTMYLDSSNSSTSFYRVSNLNGAGHQILTVPPTLVDATPRMVGLVLNPDDASPVTVGETTHETEIVMSGDRKTIILNFDDYVKKESGYIRIRPSAGYPIPPVIPVESYTVSTGQDAGVYVEGFNDILNSLGDSEDPDAATSAQIKKYREYLQISHAINGTDSSGGVPLTPVALTDSYGLSLTTGQYYGPYLLSTQGLMEGAGYPADPEKARDFNQDTSTTKHLSSGGETNWNPVGTGYMVPDTSAKYVLDYRYRINLNSTAYNATTNPGGYTATENANQLMPGGATASGYRPTTYVQDVANIRKALDAAKFRWQEIDVLSVAISGGDPSGNKPSYLGRIVTITLDTPLPAGMKWDLTIDKDAFMDEAGNGIDAINAGKYWFWSNGAQTPVIRVNRQSLDQRTGLDRRVGGGGYSSSPTPNAASFNSVSFRVESETPGAAITYSMLKGADKPDTGTYTPPAPPAVDTNLLAADEYAWGAVLFNATPNQNDTDSWTASIPAYTYTSPSYSFPTASWGSKNGVAANHAAGGGTLGTNNVHRWIRPNLIFRAIQVTHATSTPNPGIKYIVTENGVPVTRDGNGSIWIMHSYNRDARKTVELNVTPATSYPPEDSSPGRTTYPDAILVFSGSANAELKASKNYVIAQAVAPHSGGIKPSDKGYEGIFKTVVAYYAGNNATSNYGDKGFDMTSNAYWVFGSNSLSSLPSIAGFPLREASSDARYARYANDGSRNGGNSDNNPYRFYWISTEVVSNWYMQFASMQNSSGPTAACLIYHGDVGSRYSGSYGDISYAYYLDRD